MMTRIDRYLARHYLLGCLPVLLGLGGLFSFLALSEELEDVGAGVYSTADALLVTALTTPARFVELLPVVLLTGGLLGLGSLARHHEIIALRAAGFSVLRLALPVLVVAAGAVLLAIGLRFAVIPAFELRAEQLRAGADAVEFTQDEEGPGFWMRGPGQIVHVERLVDGRVLQRPEIYRLDEAGRVGELITARRAELSGRRQWLLRDVRLTDFSRLPPRRRQLATMDWHSPLTESQTSSLVVPLHALSPLALYRSIRALERQGLENRRYRLMFWQQVTQPLGMLVMAVLCLPFLLGTQRVNGLAAGALLGGGMGILFYLGEQMLGHLSGLLAISPVWAAAAPEALLMLLAWLLIRRARGA